MKRAILFFTFFGACFLLSAQTNEAENRYENAAENMLKSDSRLTIGGYGEVHYNQELDALTYNNGKLDVHRVIMLLGYNFSDKTQFITELEFEHVKEVYVEQAFLQHKINNYLNFRGGLLLIPMGIINEYHEPTTFNGVERPNLDKYIVPTTWREIGFGFTGNILPASLRYQAYLVNGFNGYDGSAKLNGKNGLRSGRQKGAESYINSPNFSGKLEYYGIGGLNLGLSGYFGNTQSTLFDGVDKSNTSAVATADSSVVGINMIGLDARYTNGALQLRGQVYTNAVSNTAQYNKFTGSDLGSGMMGYYVEAAYDVLRSAGTDMQLYPFVRYEYFDTQQKVAGDVQKDAAFAKKYLTSGLTLHLAKGAVLKCDLQLSKNETSNSFAKTFNAGFGVFF